MLAKEYKSKLIFRGSEDGFTAQSFHNECDYYGITLTVIQSDKNFIFGAFTDIPWDNEGEN